MNYSYNSNSAHWSELQAQHASERCYSLLRSWNCTSVNACVHSTAAPLRISDSILPPLYSRWSLTALTHPLFWHAFGSAHQSRCLDSNTIASCDPQWHLNTAFYWLSIGLTASIDDTTVADSSRGKRWKVYLGLPYGSGDSHSQFQVVYYSFIKIFTFQERYFHI